MKIVSNYSYDGEFTLVMPYNLASPLVPPGTTYVSANIWDDGFVNIDPYDGAFYCNDGSYLGWVGDALIGVFPDDAAETLLTEAAFGAKCIFAGTFEYQF